MNYACAAAIGAVSGLRAMTGPAIIVTAARAKRLRETHSPPLGRALCVLRKDLRHTPVGWLASSQAAKIVTALAIGEMIADKLPFIPDRIKPASLAGRAAAGALCGYAVFISQGRRGAIIGAFVGASAALAASWAGFEYRRKAPLPKLASAIIEDAVAAGAGTFLLRNLCG